MREDGQAVDDALYALAMGPDTRVITNMSIQVLLFVIDRRCVSVMST